MKKQFVTYEIALKLKELGFDEECFAIFFRAILNNGRTVNYISDDWESPFYKNRTNSESNSVDIVSAPLWQQVIDWLRDEHDIVIEIVRQKYFDTYANSYAYEVVCKVYKNKELEGSVVIRDNKNNHIFYSYEEAREHAILKAIELCKDKKS